MRALNVLLALLVSLLLAALVLEGGLRLIGLGPPVTLGQFDPELGWVKMPNLEVQRHTREFDVHFRINALGLRGDPMSSPLKPAGTLRVLMLGDSFVQGYTVEREDLFVDILERWWKSEGRDVDVINAGTEGYSTDQEALWLAGRGRAFQPDVVLLFPYENDLFWNRELSYPPYPKPRINPDGRPELRVLADPGPKPAWQKCALGSLVEALTRPRRLWTPEGGHPLPMEDAAFFHDPPEFMNEALLRTRGALENVKDTCTALKARLLVVPIPHKASIQAAAQEALAGHIGVDAARWSADQPTETFLALCKELSLETIDSRPGLKGELYFQSDWHFNPAGNRAFAAVLHDELDRRGVFPSAYAAKTPADEPPEPAREQRLPLWPFVFAALWLALGSLYAASYRDEPAWRAFLQVGALLALVFTIAMGGSRLIGLLPLNIAAAVFVLVGGGLLIFVLCKLGRRIATTLELLLSFTRRGHWYLLPLVAVLLSIGSLLVVAASSPLVAPFIYTLF
jgi:lysophospholipase L1-like esterase